MVILCSTVHEYAKLTDKSSSVEVSTLTVKKSLKLKTSCVFYSY